MAKTKKPAQKKGGVKKAASKKVAKRAPKKLTERQIDQLNADKMRADAFASTQRVRQAAEEQFDSDAALMQALHDPENQPSQYGTVPMSYLDKPKKPSLFARWRSAISGLFVSKTFAAANPDTTVRERVKP